MKYKVDKAITRWFLNHRHDGEFVDSSNATPYCVIGPSPTRDAVVYTTKPSAIATAILSSAKLAGIGLIGRYGLPSDIDALWIRRFVGASHLLFLGDMDPADLLVYAWLRAKLPAGRISYLGINDEYLRRVRASLPETFMLRCSPSEVRALQLLKRAFPDFPNVLGPECTTLLQTKRKIELEAIVSAKGGVTGILPIKQT